MSEKFLLDETRRIEKLSRKMEKYQRKQMRHYLGTVRYKMNRKRRWLLLVFSVALFLYLSCIWQLREKILSVREMEVIEYEMAGWKDKTKPDREENAHETKTSTKIRFHIKTGELEILHERADMEK